MNDPFIRAGLALGLVLVAAYMIYWRKIGQIPDVAEAIRLLFACLGIAAGIKVFTIILDAQKLIEVADGDRVYLFIGSFATVWVFAQVIIKAFRIPFSH
ncbi:MAG: hypothetical protein WAN11_13500 [Syntrophobacteraceae bacterium]